MTNIYHYSKKTKTFNLSCVTILFQQPSMPAALFLAMSRVFIGTRTTQMQWIITDFLISGYSYHLHFVAPEFPEGNCKHVASFQ